MGCFPCKIFNCGAYDDCRYFDDNKENNMIVFTSILYQHSKKIESQDQRI